LNGVQLLKRITRWVLLLSACLVIFLALLISIGRETIDDLDNYRSHIHAYASEVLGLELTSGALHGEWHQFTPEVSARDLAIYAPGQKTPAITLDYAKLDLNLVQSILSRQLVWRELHLGEINLAAKEDENGAWTIAGLALNGGGDSSGLLDVLLYSAYLDVKLVSFKLAFFSGTEAVLEARDIRLENSGDFHRLLASVNLAGAEHSAKLIVEGRGDHRDLEDFDALAYLKLNRIDFSGSLNALAKGWFPETVERIGNIETDIEGEIWIKIVKGGDANLVGRLSAAEVPLNWLEDAEPLTNFKADITGWLDPGKDWGLRLQELDFDWGDIQIEPLTINFLQKVGAQWGTGSLAVSQMNLGLLDDMLVKTRLAPDVVANAAQQLQPTGNIRKLHIDLSLENDKPDVHLRANLDDLAVSSWRGAPAARQINGYMEVNNTSGFVELDSPDGFALHYPQVFDEFMEHSSMKGQVSWRWDAQNKAVNVTSGPLEMDGDEGQGKVFLYLNLPIGQPELKPEMYLSVGVRNTHSKYRNRYIPDNLDPALLSWLDESIGDMVIPEVGFIWRGPLVGGEGGLRSIQLYVHGVDGELKFQPDWPPLERLDTVITLDTGELDTDILAANLGKARVKQADVLIRTDVRNNSQNLLIKGLVQSDLGDAIDVLAQSPLKSRVQGLDGWVLSGSSGINLDLTIPLGANKGKANTRSGSYKVDTIIDRGLMLLPKSQVAFKELKGILKYRDKKGLYAEKLHGRFWGEPVVARLETEKTDLLINVDGRLSMPALGKFLNLPSDQVLLGKTDVLASVHVPLEDTSIPIRLNVKSQLNGAEINLPAPFGKAANSQRHVEAKVVFSKNMDLQLSLDKKIKSHLVLKNGSVLRGLLAVNSDHKELPEPGQLLAVGHLKSFSLSQWQQAYPTIINFADTTSSTNDNGSHSLNLTPIFDVKIDQLDVAGLEFEDASVNGGYQNSEWMIGVESDRAEGHVLISSDESAPMMIDLERLFLPTPTEAGGDAEELDPSTLPHIQLAVRNFGVGDKRFGEANLLMKPQANGVKISGINANLLGLQLGDPEHETRLEWTVENNRHHTSFDGLLRAGNIGEVMKAWQLPAILDSKEAHFFAGLNWKGRPWDISHTTMSGAMSLHLEKGRFYKSPTGAANALIRLVGLFNFGNWVRRLQLDFSDLFEKGMSYDEMRGGLVFDRGTLTFDAPMVVKLPSGRIKMEGEANLVSEEIDAELVTTLPVGTNLPWVAAAIGGLPAAAGVYLTSKVFKKQVDKLSSISYSIEGSWNEPEIQVQKIFSDSTSGSKKSKTQPNTLEKASVLEPVTESVSESVPVPEGSL
jgi:uncharacterized protein (TIGR02099 family)